MGAAYTCVAVTSLTAAFTFRNFEAAMVMLLQAALLSMIGCIVRPRMPDDVYNDGQKDSVQSSQMVAVITGWIGAFGPLVAVCSSRRCRRPSNTSRSSSLASPTRASPRSKGEDNIMGFT